MHRATRYAASREPARCVALDWHCLADGGRADILHLATALAEEYGLAARVWLDDGRRKTREQGKPVVDNAFLDSYSIGLDDKAGTYDHEGVTVIDYRRLQQAWNA